MTGVPAQLATMHSLIGTSWSPSDPVSPIVTGWMQDIGAAYPEMAAYCASVMHQYFSWCGGTVAYCTAKNGIRPVFGATDVKRFLWAQGWLVDWGTPVTVPQPGDVLIFDFGGGDHHVTLFDHDNGDGTWACIGGNQSHTVKLSNYSKSQCMGIRRPPGVGAIAMPASSDAAVAHPLIKMGDTGPAVGELQALLGVAVDSEFGPDTDAAVRALQAAHGLDADGEVGPLTWGLLLSGVKPPVIASNVPHAAEYLDYWRRMTILPAHAGELDTIARQLLGNKSRYQAAVAGTKVPWFFVAVIHQRESSANFGKNIHNGQALGQVTTIEPLGRGPFPSFEASVNDWIALKGLNKIVEWPVERFAYQCELNNGMGYRNQGVPSAYLWSFSNIYKGGKFPRDHFFDPSIWDEQCGTMPMLKQMMALDATIAVTAPEPTPMPDQPQPTGQLPATINIDWAKIERIAEMMAKLADAMDKQKTGTAAPPATDAAPQPAPAPAAQPSIWAQLAQTAFVKILPMLGMQGGLLGVVGTLLSVAQGVAGPVTTSPTTGTLLAGFGGTLLSGLFAKLFGKKT